MSAQDYQHNRKNMCVCVHIVPFIYPTRFLLWEHERVHNGSPSLQWSVLMVCHSRRKMHVCRVILNEYLLPRWCWKLPQKLLWSIMAMSTYGLLNPQIRCCAQELEAITFSSVRGASAAQIQLRHMPPSMLNLSICLFMYLFIYRWGWSY